MTELDVKLPGKIAVTHAEQTLAERETLPRVDLPGREQIATIEPEFAPEAFPALGEAGRPTELVHTPRVELAPRPLPVVALLLIGAAIGSAVTLVVAFLLL